MGKAAPWEDDLQLAPGTRVVVSSRSFGRVTLGCGLASVEKKYTDSLLQEKKKKYNNLKTTFQVKSCILIVLYYKSTEILSAKGS